jgi:hypothetical protein
VTLWLKALCPRSARSYRTAYERTGNTSAARLDHRRLRDRRHQGGVHGAAHRQISRSSRDHAAGRPKSSPSRWRGRKRGDDFARAAIVKDAGDDPDVTHGALIDQHGPRGEAGSGRHLQAPARASALVTRPGLPIPPGEPAINPCRAP